MHTLLKSIPAHNTHTHNLSPQPDSPSHTCLHSHAVSANPPMHSLITRVVHSNTQIVWWSTAARFHTYTRHIHRQNTILHHAYVAAVTMLRRDQISRRWLQQHKCCTALLPLLALPGTNTLFVNPKPIAIYSCTPAEVVLLAGTRSTLCRTPAAATSACMHALLLLCAWKPRDCTATACLPHGSTQHVRRAFTVHWYPTSCCTTCHLHWNAPSPPV